MGQALEPTSFHNGKDTQRSTRSWFNHHYSAAQAIGDGNENAREFSARHRLPAQLPGGSVCATPLWQSIQVIPLFACEECASAAIAGCFAKAIALAV